MNSQMSKERIQPIYDAVNDIISSTTTADDLPGSNELYDLITTHCQFVLGGMPQVFGLMELKSLLQNTLYLGVVVGLVYGHKYGLPDWVTFYLRGGEKWTGTSGQAASSG